MSRRRTDRARDRVRGILLAAGSVSMQRNAAFFSLFRLGNGTNIKMMHRDHDEAAGTKDLVYSIYCLHSPAPGCSHHQCPRHRSHWFMVKCDAVSSENRGKETHGQSKITARTPHHSE